MKRRLHDCDIWKKKWFRRLKPEHKCFVLYLFDNCTNAGFWDVDTDLAGYHINTDIDLSKPKDFLPDDFDIIEHKHDKWWLPKFIKFHYPNGVGSNKPAVIGVRKELEENEILDVAKEYFGKEFFEYKEVENKGGKKHEEITDEPDEPKQSRPPKEISEDGKKFAEWFKTLIPDKVNLTKDILASWASDYDMLIKTDKRDKKEIIAICKWAREDEFWKDNFLSPLKLRRKNKDKVMYYDVFKEKMNSDKQRPNGAR